ncbi:MAG: 4a-hydroxytetrahydrobiopterin dehydratase [Rhodocyclaceae bacterium]|nr:4a-hydroxytetrahydrobiopterin dehydratase [Rhodocyclaceae bacterium]
MAELSMAEPSMTDIPTGWELRGKPPTLFRRFEFPRYAATRDFLDAVAALSETHNLHPQNINFGTTYANISLEIAAGAPAGASSDAPPDASSDVPTGAAEFDFAARVNALYQSRPA